MRNSADRNRLRKIKQYYKDLSNTFAKLSLELGELIEQDLDAADIRQKAAPAFAIAKLEEDSILENSDKVLTSVKEVLKEKQKDKTKEKRVNLFKQPTNKFRVGDEV